ncbi:hypothetical protein Tco_0272194 [Tanacetum coccineum]
MEKRTQMVKDFHLYEYNKGMETRKWSEDDKRRSKDFITAIEKRLQIEWIYRNYESFVGGRIRDIDYRLINKLRDRHRHNNQKVQYCFSIEHPSETMVFHNEDGNPTRANIKQALGRHGTLLPPRDQRHPWFRYQVEGYTEDIVHNYEQRLKTIFSRPVRRLCHSINDLARKIWQRTDYLKKGLEVCGLGGSPVSFRLNDLHKLGKAKIYERIGCYTVGRWASVGSPIDQRKRQPDVAAGAPEAAEDAPARIARLEKEVHKLRRRIVGLRGDVDRSITDQGRFTTSMVSCMTQLMDASGRTNQAFDNTLIVKDKGFSITDDVDITSGVVLCMLFCKKFVSCQKIMERFAHRDECERITMNEAEEKEKDAIRRILRFGIWRIDLMTSLELGYRANQGQKISFFNLNKDKFKRFKGVAISNPSARYKHSSNSSCEKLVSNFPMDEIKDVI